MRGWACIVAACAACDGVLGLDQLHPLSQPDFSALTGLRWQLPCGIQNFGNDTCSCTDPMPTAITLGDTGAFVAHVHIQAALEPMMYYQCSTDWCVDGVPSDTVRTIAKIDVSSPPHTYFVNAGAPTSNPSLTARFDYVADLPITSPALVTFTIASQDGSEAMNHEGSASGPPITFTGAPNPDMTNGEFGYLFVDSVDRAP